MTTQLPHDLPAVLARFRGLGFTVCFPYNHDPNLWEHLQPFAGVVEEVYAELHPSVFPSMRAWNKALGSSKVHLENLKRLMRQVRPHGIALDLILNACPAEWIDENALFSCLDLLKSEGEVRVTLSDFYWARRLREQFSDLHLEVSTTVNVDDQHSALLWRDYAGVRTIVLGKRINKDPQRIAEIRALGLRTKMVVSDTCTVDCPLLYHHFAVYAPRESVEGRIATEARLMDACSQLKREVPVWDLVKKTVLPFHLPRYRGILDIIKLNDRRRSTELNIENLLSYLRMKDDVHPRFGYREPAEAFDVLSRCRRTCGECTWCAEHVKVVRPRIDLPNPLSSPSPHPRQRPSPREKGA